MESKSEVQMPKEKTIPASFLYLFTMDLCRIPFQTFAEYNKGEPDFALPMLRGYITAFQMETEGTLSPELLKKIHQASVKHLGASSDYRKEPKGFTLTLSKKQHLIPTYNASPEGLKKLINKWIVGAQTHVLAFNNDKEGDDQVVYNVTTINDKAVFETVIGGVSSTVFYDEKKHIPMLLNLMREKGFSCAVVSMYTAEEPLKETIKGFLEKIIGDYNREIVQANTNDDRIAIICTYLQQVEQLHPFVDGNIRTCYIVLNKLLNDFNMPLALLVNPNRLDACTVEELVSMVKDGQAIYTSLLNHTGSDAFVFDAPHEILDKLKTISCAGVDLKNKQIYEQFIRYVLNANATIEKIENHKALLSAVEKLNPPVKWIDAIKNNNYGLALRSACAERNLSVIKCLLEYQEILDIDINEQSSNGKTALDWFDLSTKNLESQEAVRNVLVSKGAKNKMVTPPQPEPETPSIEVSFKIGN